jgi:nicotinate-nucleotide pyrophosphorylase (carboxylating)
MWALPRIDDLVAVALAEDLGLPPAGLQGGTIGPEVLERDVTTSSVVDPDAMFQGAVVAREDCVVCGLPVAQAVWDMLSRLAHDEPEVDIYPLVAEGASVDDGTVVAEVEGRARTVLAGERTALNGLMVLSGIATAARSWQQEAGDELAVLDTRKTLPGMRTLSKYAVRVGGAHNHREGLFDMVLVKDNHIEAAGGIARAVEMARERHPDLAVEVEADTASQAAEAARAGADIVMLDNMTDDELAEAVVAVREAATEAGETVLTEASGQITLERLPAIAAAGCDRVSTSSITLAPPLDFGLDRLD